MKTIAVLLLILFVSATFAFGHSWYDLDCCSQRDCAPADEVVFNGDGATIVTITLNEKKYTIVYPKNFPKDKIRPSHDGKYHGCAQVNVEPPAPLCLYVPISG